MLWLILIFSLIPWLFPSSSSCTKSNYYSWSCFCTSIKAPPAPDPALTTAAPFYYRRSRRQRRQFLVPAVQLSVEGQACSPCSPASPISAPGPAGCARSATARCLPDCPAAAPSVTATGAATNPNAPSRANPNRPTAANPMPASFLDQFLVQSLWQMLQVKQQEQKQEKVVPPTQVLNMEQIINLLCVSLSTEENVINLSFFMYKYKCVALNKLHQF